MNQIIVQMIAVASIVFPPSARSFDQKHARKIAASVPDGGEIFQPIGVIAEGDHFRGIWGRHRLGAYELLGRKEIPARVLPEGTTPEEEAKYSLIENSVRRDESFDDTLNRVAELARLMHCSINKAAEMAQVKPSYLSRCKTASEKLSPEAKAFAKTHKLGISLIYMVATKAATPKEQLAAFQALAGGKTREEVSQLLSGKSPATRRGKKTNLVLSLDDTQIRLSVPEGMDYERLDRVLKQLNKKLLENKNVPVRLLPQILK